MDRQKQTDYTVKPRDRYHYDAYFEQVIIQRVQYSYSHKVTDSLDLWLHRAIS